MGIETTWCGRMASPNSDDMYERARTVVRTKQGYSTEFEVKVGIHQGSVLSPLLFVAVMEVVTRGVKEGLPWELLYADDLVLVAQSKEELREKFCDGRSVWSYKGTEGKYRED